jgi:ATP synthase F1 gamma subunit
MLNKYQLEAEYEVVNTLKILAHAYEEISVMRMQKVRVNVITTRAFLEKLAELFFDVKESYKKEILAIMQKKNKSEDKLVFSTHQKNGKTVYVFIASNARLYGDIIKKVFNLFLENVKKDPTADVVVVGKLGRDLFNNQQQVDRQATFFEIPDVAAKIEDLKDVVAFLHPYEKVNVFYGEFQNMTRQEASAASVSGDQPLSADYQLEGKYTFFFEPSLEKVLQFFENQVFASLLKQAVHEGELARLASRANAMESAIVNIEKTENMLKAETRKLRKSLENRKRLEGLAGVTLWT